ncbi:hypothetical protein [Streptomyces sp. NRRL F-6677]|uniref:hypothetical protein n=1 Tax=Streptomyces sp. NRRL F-6677 TaxID=1463879 RepID=UPI0004C90755|nr:hypothetical protein [Streptomyces sp. NRRL F-6677]
MNRMLKATAVATLCCTAAAGLGYAGVAQAKGDGGLGVRDAASAAWTTHTSHADRGDAFVGEKKINVEGHSVNVSCEGRQSRRGPVVVLVGRE